MICDLENIGGSDGKAVYRCRICFRELALPQASAKVTRRCHGNIPDGDRIVRVAFWPETAGMRLRGIAIEPFHFVDLYESMLADAPCKYELIEGDDSRVGSRLKELFQSLGYTSEKSCGCDRLANMLDSVSLEFIDRHRSKIVDQIAQSAAQQSVSVPHAVISRIVGYVVWKERRRLRAAKIC